LLLLPFPACCCCCCCADDDDIFLGEEGGVEGASAVGVAVLSRPLGRMDVGRYERRPRGRRGSLTRGEDDDSMVDDTVWTCLPLYLPCGGGVLQLQAKLSFPWTMVVFISQFQLTERNQ
jgi:hypothetical protein